MNPANPGLLKKVFLTDTIVSFIAGLDLILFSDLAASLLGGFSAQTYFILGVVFVAWSADLALTGFIPSLQKQFAQMVVYIDWLFAALTLICLVLLMSDFTAAGIAVMLSVSTGVAGIAWLKQKGIGFSARLSTAS